MSQRLTLLQAPFIPLETARLNVVESQASIAENSRIERMRQIPEAMQAPFTHSKALLHLHTTRLIATENTMQTTTRQCMSLRPITCFRTELLGAHFVKLETALHHHIELLIVSNLKTCTSEMVM